MFVFDTISGGRMAATGEEEEIFWLLWWFGDFGLIEPVKNHVWRGKALQTLNYVLVEMSLVGEVSVNTVVLLATEL